MTINDRFAYGTGFFILICGIIIGLTWPIIFEYISKEKLELNPSSETYKLWIKTPIPIFLEIYLFNWTNSEEFLKNNKVKPEFKEIGPFIFKETHQRVEITWNRNNTVSYSQVRNWSFVPQESVSLSTYITNLNVIATMKSSVSCMFRSEYYHIWPRFFQKNSTAIAVICDNGLKTDLMQTQISSCIYLNTVTRMASRYNTFIKYLLEFLNYIYKEKLLITRPAREWLFDGINDDLLKFLKKLVNIHEDKFGWFYGRNLSSSFDGRFNINTGKANIFNLGAMRQWNYANRTKFYEGDCGVVRGSSGELFSPIKNWQENLSIFVTDFCGLLTLKYSGSKLIEGLDGYFYVGDQSVFDNGTLNPNAKCFCTGECSPSGVRNVTSCREAPLFISFPHFYLADPIYIDSVRGIKPNKSEHEFYLGIDPVTGLPLEVRAQLQLNVLLQPLKEFFMFKSVPKIYIPMMWFRQRARVTPDLASRGKTLRLFKKIGLGVACCLGFLGLLIIIIRFFFVKYFSRRKNVEFLVTPETKEDEPYTDDYESER